MLANLRYWPTIAPLVGKELRRWQSQASEIPDPGLKALALAKLRDEHFNAQVAATLATLAPVQRRPTATAAIVACQVMYDYLDGLTEQPVPEHLQSNQLLYSALSDAVTIGAEPNTDYYRLHPLQGDDGYLQALSRTVNDRLTQLPAAHAIDRVAAAAARRCGQAQSRVHATGDGDPTHLTEWAAEQAEAEKTPLGWREWLAGAVSCVLGVHALIAAAANRATAASHALALDEAYLPIAALSTMLDSLIDWHKDQDADATPWLLSHYQHANLAPSLTRTARYATLKAQKLPHAAHHIMTMNGVAAYYTSSPAASEAHAKPAVEQLHRELGTTLKPTLKIMRAWRTAKRLTSHTKTPDK